MKLNLKEKECSMFSDLEIGEVCRSKPDDAIYMKINPCYLQGNDKRVFNALRLTDNKICAVNFQEEVIVIDGSFVEGHKRETITFNIGMRMCKDPEELAAIMKELMDEHSKNHPGKNCIFNFDIKS